MSDNNTHDSWHRRTLEHNTSLFAVLTTVAISIGGLIEIVPLFTAAGDPTPLEGITPYTALEVAGREVYMREGCVQCHSQMVRPFRAETVRYGDWSRSSEYTYDRPFLLGSRRIGPDLHRVGGKYPDAWHYEHMRDPRSTSPGSIMPAYPWLLEASIHPADVQDSMRALQTLGTPYSDAQIAQAPQEMATQGGEISGRLAQGNITAAPDSEVVALIAYLQRLGKDGRAALKAQVAQAGEAP